jgi:hypothetical protein
MGTFMRDEFEKKFESGRGDHRKCQAEHNDIPAEISTQYHPTTNVKRYNYFGMFLSFLIVLKAQWLPYVLLLMTQ